MMSLRWIFWQAIFYGQLCLWILATAGLSYLLFIFHRRHQSIWSGVGLRGAVVLLVLVGLRMTLAMASTLLRMAGWRGSGGSLLPERFWLVYKIIEAVLMVVVSLCFLVTALEARRQKEQVAEPWGGG